MMNRTVFEKEFVKLVWGSCIINEARPLYSSHSSCVFNALLPYTAVMLNMLTIYAMWKNYVVAKAFKNIAPESYCF